MFHKGKWKAAQQGGIREASHFSAALCSPPAAKKGSKCFESAEGAEPLSPPYSGDTTSKGGKKKKNNNWEIQLDNQQVSCHKLIMHRALEFESLAEEKIITKDNIIIFSAR